MTTTQQTITPETTTLSQVGIDWNNTSRWVVMTGLNEIPEVGSLVSALVGVLWPSTKVDVWGQIKDQVQALINQSISNLVYSQVQNDLAGLQNDLNLYLNAINNNDSASVIADYWQTANSNCNLYLPNFQASGYELLLLPLFAQFANLHLSLLRDGVLFGSSWGWNFNDVQDAYNQLINNTQSNSGITPYTTYANQTYQQGLQNVVKNTPTNPSLNQPFLATNTYIRGMTLMAMDYVTLWQYFDTQKYPKPVSVQLTREIYSDPQGTSDGSSNPNPIILPSAPTQPISQIAVWADSLVRAVQVTYPAGGGPNGQTQTPVMGGSANVGPTPINVTSSNPIKVAAGRSGDIVNGLMFYFTDATETAMLGGLGNGANGNLSGGTPFYYFYLDHILSSIYVHGYSNADQCADCVVFGFKLEQSQTPSLDTLRLLYVTSPTSVTLDDLATRSPDKTVDPNQLKQVAATKNWDTQRQEYWQYVQARTAGQSPT
jgi:hypothetical protein